MTTSIQNQNRSDEKNKNNHMQQSTLNNSDKNIPVKKDDDNDFTKPKSGVNEPGKNDLIRIDETNKEDTTRIDIPRVSGQKRK
ncbi:MAG: hypothetical protein ABI855_08035 [Bacteroidota bacterium]